MNGRAIQWLDRHLYPGVEDNWDDAELRQTIIRYLDAGTRILDLGAGAGIVPQMNFRGIAARVSGIDPDPRVLSNPFLDDARVASGEAIPYPSGSFDLVFADNVLEHLPEPVTVLREVARVLRPGGRFIAKTPNRRHYVAVLARVTPDRFHRIYNRWRGRPMLDTFPTLYAANTPETLTACAQAAGLDVTAVRLMEGRPEYLRVTALTYLMGYCYERIVNSVTQLARFRVVMLAVLRKPESLG